MIPVPADIFVHPNVLHAQILAAPGNPSSGFLIPRIHVECSRDGGVEGHANRPVLLLARLEAYDRSLKERPA